MAFGISYWIAYRSSFLERFFSDLIVPVFTKLDKRYLRFERYENVQDSVDVEWYRRVFFFVFLPLFILLIKTLLDPGGDWGLLNIIVLISPALVIFRGKNLHWFRMGIYLGGIGAAGVYLYNEFGVDYTDTGKVPFTWHVALFAGLLLPFASRLTRNYAGNYHFLKNHRIFQNVSRTTIHGKHIPSPKVLVNKILNFYLFPVLPLLMLYSLVSIGTGTYGGNGIFDELVNSDDGLVTVLLFAFSFLAFINVIFVVLPLTKGMFQYRIFAILGRFQDKIEDSDSQLSVMGGYDEYKQEYGDVAAMSDLLLFVFMLDSLLSAFVRFRGLFSLGYISSENMITISAILKVELYFFILAGLLLHREEKQTPDFFKSIQKSFMGNFIDLTYLRLGRKVKFERRKWLKQSRDFPADPAMKASIWMQRAAALIRMSRSGLALKCLKQAGKSQPGNPDVSVMVGRAHEQMGHTRQALRHFETIIREEPGNWKAHYYMGLLHFHAGRFDEAIERLDRSLELNPVNPDAHYYRARCYLPSGNYGEALRSMDSAEALNPTHYFTLFYKARALLGLERYAEAFPYIQRALRIDPGYLKLWEMRGDCLAHLGLTGAALRSFDISDDIMAGSGIWLKYALAYRTLGMDEQANAYSKIAHCHYNLLVEKAASVLKKSQIVGQVMEDLRSVGGELMQATMLDTVAETASGIIKRSAGPADGTVVPGEPPALPARETVSGRIHKDLSLGVEEMDALSIPGITEPMSEEQVSATMKEISMFVDELRFSRKEAAREMGFALLALGHLELEGRDFARAEEQFNRAIETCETYLRESLLSHRKTVDAVMEDISPDLTQSQTELFGYEDDSYRAIGDLCMGTGRFEGAVDAYSESARVEGAQAIEHFKLALAYYHLSTQQEYPLQIASSLDNARQQFETVKRLAGERLYRPESRFFHAEATIYLGEMKKVLESQGRVKAMDYFATHQDALESYRKYWISFGDSCRDYVEEIWQKTPDGRYELVGVKEEGKYDARAAECYGRVMDIYPDSTVKKRLAGLRGSMGASAE